MAQTREVWPEADDRAARGDRVSEAREPSEVLFWASAYLLYLAAYTGAVFAAGGLSPLAALFAALANSLPAAAAAPLIVHLATATVGRRGDSLRNGIYWLFAAATFVAWSVLAPVLGGVILDVLRQHGWSFALSPNTMWKALLSLAVFAALGGSAIARAHARRARHSEARAERAETLRAEARLAALRAQLNPHFILNVLHSLVGLAQRDPGLTAVALERLGLTLRYALRVQSHAVDTVPLRDELEFTREYLELERLRLGDRLETRIAVPEALLDSTVPSFVLQPLVENSIRHAIAPRARGGSVAITVKKPTAGALELSVEDDGTALAEGMPDPWREGAGRGLRLLSERLQALYGTNANLELCRSHLGGLRSVIRIPDDLRDLEPEGK